MLKEMENKEVAEDPETLEAGSMPLCNLGSIYHALFGHLRLREERIPPAARATGATQIPEGRATLAMSNLGALSRVIDEYDLLHFRQTPALKLAEFARWLQSEAPLFFEDVGEAAAASGADGLRLSEPDAVTLTTIHRAKGREWPAVFVPGLTDGRFPHDGLERGRTHWHILPRRAVRDAARYDTTLAEETRLMYVAVTRAKKFLHCSFAADPAAARVQLPSPFLRVFEQAIQEWQEDKPGQEDKEGPEHSACPDVRTQETGKRETERQKQGKLAPVKLPPRPRGQAQALTLTFSRLSAFLRCPYLFKLRALYGWTAPPAEAEGYGKGTHDALAEVHARLGENVEGGRDARDTARALVARHLLLPYASPERYAALAEAATEQVAAYLEAEAAQIAATVHQEMPYEISLEDTLTVTGRNDVIWERDGERTLREVKSRREVQSEDLSRTQLYVEAMGAEAATGQAVHYLEVYNLAGQGADRETGATGPGEAGIQFRERFEQAKAETVRVELQVAARQIRARALPRLKVISHTCLRCDHRDICRDAAAPAAHEGSM